MMGFKEWMIHNAKQKLAESKVPDRNTSTQKIVKRILDHSAAH